MSGKLYVTVAENFIPIGSDTPKLASAFLVQIKKLPIHKLQLPTGVSEPLQAATSFQLAYDDRNLYVRVEAELPAALMDSFHPRGCDEELGLQECINILLAPSGFRSQYYYLTYEPVADSISQWNSESA